MLYNLTCIGQARIIGGAKKQPHVCSIVLDNGTGNLLRVCLPYGSSQDMGIRRWSKFTAKLVKLSADTRPESYFIDDSHTVEYEPGKSSVSLHRHLLSLACPEDELKDKGLTIGVKRIVDFSLHFVKLDDRHRRYKETMSMRYNLWYPSKLVKISGTDALTGMRYSRLLLDWQIHEALRKGKHLPEKQVENDLRKRLLAYKMPYLITGTTLVHRKSFMAVSVLSAPKSCG
jgi:hypothetical protein